jgi:hypothetical protein
MEQAEPPDGCVHVCRTTETAKTRQTNCRRSLRRAAVLLIPALKWWCSTQALYWKRWSARWYRARAEKYYRD